MYLLMANALIDLGGGFRRYWDEVAWLCKGEKIEVERRSSKALNK